MSEIDQIRDDLHDEEAALDQLVAGITDEQWQTPTPSPGWTVADQIGHLAYFDGTAAVAIVDPDQFESLSAALFEAAGRLDGNVDDLTLGEMRSLSPEALVARWRENRAALAQAARALSDTARVPWYGPSMGAKSFLTARLMETWAHGTDVADALSERLAPTERLRHIVQLGYITRGWSYVVRGEQAPEGSVRLELTSPAGALWTYGPHDADDVVVGDAEEFCWVVTQRRNLADTSLRSGELGTHWLERAQAFAGGATSGPAPRGH